MIRGADGIFRVGVPSPDIGKVGWFVSIVNFICVFAIHFLGAYVVPMAPQVPIDCLGSPRWFGDSLPCWPKCVHQIGNGGR